MLLYTISQFYYFNFILYYMDQYQYNDEENQEFNDEEYYEEGNNENNDNEHNDENNNQIKENINTEELDKNKSVFISGLPYTTTENEVKELFKDCGRIKYIYNKLYDFI